jgi:hypothetical protein
MFAFDVDGRMRIAGMIRPEEISYLSSQHANQMAGGGVCKACSLWVAFTDQISGTPDMAQDPVSSSNYGNAVLSILVG